MRFDQRKSAALAEVKIFLSNFASPRGLSLEAQAVHIKGISDAFARKLPVTEAAQFSENIEKTFTSIRDTHKGYAWPVQSEFVDAMPKNFRAAPKIETFKSNILAGRARLMNAGEAVGESFVWGVNSWPLVSSGLIDRATLDNYRQGSVMHHQSSYDQDAYDVLQSRYGDLVTPYFQSNSGVAT
jgi:hypothetical protein